MADPAVYRTVGSSHTTIVVADNGKIVQHIPMSSLQVQKQDAREFYTEWEPMPLYPVQRAAMLYLGATQYREMSPKAREHLEAIAGNKKLAFDEARIIPQPANKEISMATKTAPAKQPATSKLAKTAPAKTKVAGNTSKLAKTAPAKTKVAGNTEQPAKAAPAKKAAPTAPAKAAAPAKQAAPAKKAAPAKNGMDTVVAQASKKTAAPAKQAAPAKGSAVPRVSPNADQKLRVAEPDKPRRGVTQEFVNEAVKLKTFTRQQLLDVMVKKGHEEKSARIKIADCVYFKVFEAA